MQKVIHKHQIQLNDDTQDIVLPVDSEILRFGEQEGNMYIWVLRTVNDTCTVLRQFRLYGTGNSFDDQKLRKYIGTVIEVRRRLVWHLFEV